MQVRKKLLLKIVILSLLIGIAALTSHFLYRNVRIQGALNDIIEEGVSLELSTEDVNVVDYRSRTGSTYIKFELTPEIYDYIKHKLLLLSGTETNTDFTADLVSEESGYRFNSDRFLSELSIIKNIKSMGKYHSMNIDEYKELLTMDTTYAKDTFLGGTTGSRRYILVKEDSGNHYLYYTRN